MSLIAPGSSSLLPHGPPYKCQGFNCYSSTLSQSSASVDMAVRSWVAATLQKRTHRCVLTREHPVWFWMPKAPEEYGTWAAFICLCHIKEKETGADVHKVAVLVRFRTPYIPVSPRPVAGLCRKGHHLRFVNRSSAGFQS